MQPTEQTCDSGRIDVYLDERMSVPARDEFEHHLSHCDYCQIEVQRRAADPDLWRDAAELLGEDNPDSWDHAGDSPGTDRRQRCTMSIMESLTATDDPEMLGRLGDYEISGVVGVGGMGAVLKGFDRSLRRVVAIKVMAPHLAGSGSARTRFQREARAAAGITHDNVIDTYGVSEAGGLPYLVMPFARGPSLQKRIDSSGPLTATEVVRIGRQIASGLAAAHEQGLVHRDIKPANILLNEGIERLWITDFGVARAMDDASMTQTGVIAGTPQFMSPEQARGESVDHRSDLFSMGSVLYTACTGRPPFRSEAAYGMLRRITDTEPQPIRELNPEIPEWLCHIIGRLMKKDASKRYQTAGEVAALLEGCLAHLQQPALIELPADLISECNAPKAETSTEDIQTTTSAGAAASGDPPAGNTDTNTAIAFVQRPVFRFALAAATVAALCMLAWQTTEPADISGDWTGGTWTSVSLSTVKNASGWYSGSFTGDQAERGALQLEWSRLQQRYIGRWKIGDGATGSITLRLQNGEIRGAIAFDAASPTRDDMPRLRDFLWKRGAPAEQTAAATSSAPPSTRHQNEASTQDIESPVKGRLIRYAQGIQNHARVERGDLIAEIVLLDPAATDRLRLQHEAALQQVEATENLVTAQKRNLKLHRDFVDTYNAQLESYKKVEGQIEVSSNAAMTSVKDRIQIEEITVDECKAALRAAETVYTRNKKLFDENVLSEQKLQASQQTFDEARAGLAKAEAVLRAAQNELAQAEAEGKVKQEKARIDISYAQARVHKAESELAAAEQDLATAQLDLTKAQKAVVQSEANLSKQHNFLIRAPFSGVVSKLRPSGSVLKSGDVICQIQADEGTAATPTSPSAIDEQAVAAADTPARSFDAANLNVASASPASVTDTIEAALSVGRRLRSIFSQLNADVSGNTEKGNPAIEQSQAMQERNTAIVILASQLNAAQQQHHSQTALRNVAQRRVETGEAPADSLTKCDLELLKTATTKQQLEFLLQYFRDIGDDATKPDIDGQLSRNLITVHRDAAQRRIDLLTTLTKNARRRFETGDAEIDDVVETEQALTASKADLETARALLQFYADQTTDDTKAPDPDQ